MLVGNIVKNIRMTTPITLGIAGGTGAVSRVNVVFYAVSRGSLLVAIVAWKKER